MINKRKILNTLKEYLLLTLACFVFAMAWEGFMIPNGMSAGGMMGLSTVIQYATGGLIPAQYTYVVINVVLILVAMWFMGIGFGFKTIYCIILSTIMMGIVGNLEFLHCVEGQFFYVQDRLLVPLIAGCLEAVSIGIIIRNGGSTGGTDIIALMINKFWPVSLSTAFIILDLVIVTLILLLPGKIFTDMIYGIVEIVAFSILVDVVVSGQKGSYQILVFSDKYKEIADHIINDMGRGVTVLRAQGWYTKSDKNLLLILIGRQELPSLMKKIKQVDAKAFMSVSPTNNVYGEGFEEIKVGIGSKKIRKYDD